MKSFMGDDFLLTSFTARELYHEGAEHLPVFDYCSYVSADAIALNSRYENLSQLLLSQDHYAWRLMLTDGVEEDKIRGNAPDWEKFLAYAKVLQGAIGHPLYHLTHLALRRIFDVNEPLNQSTARHIWDECNEKLKSPEFSAQGLLAKFRVHTVCTAEDPLSDLKAHQRIRSNAEMQFKARPTFCPDKALQIGQTGFTQFVLKLGEICGQSINNLQDLLSALEKRVDYFHAAGCRSADHTMASPPLVGLDEEKADKAFRSALLGQPLKSKQIAGFQSLLFGSLGQQYAKRNWVQQYHIGSIRNNNLRLSALFGSDAGFDSVTDEPIARGLSQLLDAQDATASLPRTVLYCINPAQNLVIASMISNFQQSGIPCKIQMGPPRRFQNQHEGVRNHLLGLANASLLKRNIGMTSDSPSFAGFSRHEYFRRILCETIGNWVEYGEYPNDLPYLTDMVRDISFHNAVAFFP